MKIPDKWPLNKCRSTTQNASHKSAVPEKIILILDMNAIKRAGGKDDQVHRLHKQQNRSELFSLEDMIEYINIVFNTLSGLEMADNDSTSNENSELRF